MNIDTACQLIATLIYKPGWKFQAASFEKRHEGVIALRVTYPAMNSDRDQADNGFPNEVPGGVRADFVMPVGDLKDATCLYKRLLCNVIMKIEEHEAREFLRVQPTKWAPFHPHHQDGMERWGDMESDLKFGYAHSIQFD